jgi:hypothetical protein
VRGRLAGFVQTRLLVAVVHVKCSRLRGGGVAATAVLLHMLPAWLVEPAQLFIMMRMVGQAGSITHHTSREKQAWSWQVSTRKPFQSSMTPGSCYFILPALSAHSPS